MIPVTIGQDNVVDQKTCFNTKKRTITLSSDGSTKRRMIGLHVGGSLLYRGARWPVGVVTGVLRFNGSRNKVQHSGV